MKLCITTHYYLGYGWVYGELDGATQGAEVDSIRSQIDMSISRLRLALVDVKMFHVKHNPVLPTQNAGLRILYGPLVLLAIILSQACTNLDSPDGWASPVGDTETIFAQTESGVISLLRLSPSGALVEVDYPTDSDDIELTAVYATPILDRNTLYIASYSGIIAALDANTLTLSRDWNQVVQVDGAIVATPHLDGGTLYVATEEGSLIEINAADGRQSTLATIPDRIWSRPAIDSSHLYVASLDGKLRAINRITGNIDWQRDVGTVAGDLAVAGNLLLVPSFDKAVRALDITAEGTDLWPSTGGLGEHWFWAQPLIVGDTVYAPTVAGTVHAFNIRDGSEVWQFQQDKTEIRARPSLVSGVLLIASTDGHLYGIEPSTGDLIWATLQDDRSFLADPLVLESDGTVLYSDKNGSLSRVTAATGSLEMLFKPD